MKSDKVKTVLSTATLIVLLLGICKGQNMDKDKIIADLERCLL